MKIWMCSHGSYSDWQPTAFYTDKQTAQTMTDAYGWDNDPQEHELDPDVPQEVRHGLIHWHVTLFFDAKGKQEAVSAERGEPRKYEWLDKLTKLRHDGGQNFNSDVWARDKDHAIKITADRLAAFQSTSKGE